MREEGGQGLEWKMGWGLKAVVWGREDGVKEWLERSELMVEWKLRDAGWSGEESGVKGVEGSLSHRSTEA